MKFRYLTDPVFMVCLGIYLVNKLVLKPLTTNSFVHGQVCDLICVPFWIPIMLFVMRRVGLRRHDSPPQAHEILIALLVWSWSFENYIPTTRLFIGRSIADHLDVLSYTIGAIVAAIVWNRYYGVDAFLPGEVDVSR